MSDATAAHVAPLDGLHGQPHSPALHHQFEDLGQQHEADEMGMWLFLAFMYVGVVYGFTRWIVVIPYVLARRTWSLQEWRQKARLWGWTLSLSLLSIALLYGASLWYPGIVFRAHLATAFPIYGLIAGPVSLLALPLYIDALIGVRRQKRVTAA